MSLIYPFLVSLTLLDIVLVCSCICPLSYHFFFFLMSGVHSGCFVQVKGLWKGMPSVAIEGDHQASVYIPSMAVLFVTFV